MNERPDDSSLRQALHELADAFEADAPPEDVVADELAARLGRRSLLRIAGTVGLAAAVVLAAAFGLRILTEPALGGPAPIPALAGVFVTIDPDAAGRCHAVRLYDSTAADGRVALWTWSAGTSCEERTDNLSSGLGRASGVRLAFGPGIVVEAAPGVPPPLEALTLVLDARGPVIAYPSVQAAGSATDGRPMEEVPQLDIPYRPE